MAKKAVRKKKPEGKIKVIANPEVQVKRTEHRHGLSVVGIGASAGGLEAFSKLLTHLPVGTGMAFVLLQHLDPHH